MKIYFSGDTIEYPSPSVALGNFDGMHKGHLRIIQRARESGESFGALLFEKHTSFTVGKGVRVITPLYEKLEIMYGLGADFVYLVSFDESFMNMSCEDFCAYIAQIGAASVSVGYDYRFGKNAAGNVDVLKTQLEKFGIDTIITDAVTEGGEPIKSSRIRNLIECGDMRAASELMSRPLRRSGIVVPGFQNGRRMGFPTANLECDSGALLPDDGVYYGRCIVDGESLAAVINVGKNPTFNAQERTIEAHIIDYNKDLYGTRISVDFYGKIRGEMRFSSIEELKRQIAADKEYAKTRLIKGEKENG